MIILFRCKKQARLCLPTSIRGTIFLYIQDTLKDGECLMELNKPFDHISCLSIGWLHPNFLPLSKAIPFTPSKVRLPVTSSNQTMCIEKSTDMIRCNVDLSVRTHRTLLYTFSPVIMQKNDCSFVAVPSLSLQSPSLHRVVHRFCCDVVG